MRYAPLVTLLLAAPVLAGESAPQAELPGAAPAAVPSAPSSGELSARSFEVGLSAQYAYGLGRETRSALMGDLTFGTVPLVLDASYLFGPHLALGAYVGWGPMFANGCQASVSCTGSSLRFGVRARYRFGENASLLPWVAVGAGFERLVESDSFQTTTVDSAVSGFELVRLELGAEHRVASSFALGPFVSGSVGRYTARELSGRAVDLGGQAFHYWVAGGLRGSFSL